MILKNFIVFEGLDGAGTTTQSRLLSEKIKNSFLTFEPTNNNIGKIVRQALKKEITLTPETLAYLFAADRNEHINGIDGIKQKCLNNQTVICDRYIFSSLAYQTLETDFEKIFFLSKDFPLPEILFFLNTDIEICQSRLKKRDEIEELFDEYRIQNEILNNYKKSFDYFKESGLNVVMLDGNLEIIKLLDLEYEVFMNINR